MDIIENLKWKIKHEKLPLKEEFFSLRDWLYSEYNLTLIYVYRGGFFNVESGHYLDATILFVKDNLSKINPPLKLREIRGAIQNQFPELMYDTKYHRAWNILPEDTISIVSINSS
ncbi:MAG: hypothetical protein JJT78_17180 [Leptospira sp.]|nr:hypothetical protein [Leptospira sp.]